VSRRSSDYLQILLGMAGGAGTTIISLWGRAGGFAVRRRWEQL
jgi:hypothetical protein